MCNSADEYISILLKSWLLTRTNMICASVHLPSFATGAVCSASEGCSSSLAK